MKISYKTATEEIEIETSRKWAEWIDDEDRVISNQNRKERRNTLHYDESFEYGDWLASDKDNPFYNLCRETPEEELNRLRYAISRLTKDQQRLIEYVYYKGYSMKAFAEIEGVTPKAISKRHQTILKKLREIF